MRSEVHNSERSEDRVDAFTAEVIRSALVAITSEMKTNLMRTAYHTIIYEAEDFTVGLFDADGNTISIGLGLPMFIRGLSDAIKAKISHWGRENIEPGDILLTNDSYIMGSHLNHMIYTLPIFNDGELVAFSSSMAHWQDIGGQLGGVTRDIFSEGLQMPFVKHFRAGVENPEITSIIKTNVRVDVKDDQVTIDLSNVSPQGAGRYNSGVTAGRSAAEVVFKCITSPMLLPINDGSFRPLKIILPLGRVVSALKPAPVRVWAISPTTTPSTGSSTPRPTA